MVVLGCRWLRLVAVGGWCGRCGWLVVGVGIVVVVVVVKILLKPEFWQVAGSFVSVATASGLSVVGPLCFSGLGLGSGC